MIEQWIQPAVWLFVAGLIYQAGRLSQRVDNLTERIAALENELRRELAEIKGMLLPIARRRHGDPEGA